jgi:hypothetical protein
MRLCGAVARTMDLRETRQTFVDVLTNGDAAWQSSSATPPQRRKTVAEDIFLRFVVGCESFASEWLIGRVNHDASRLSKARVRQNGAGASCEYA